MLIEQAFYNLPEILLGSGYNLQDYEAGIVNAFSLALLQVLNGRNINDPIGCLQAEKLYRNGGIYPNNEDPRYFRSDLFLNTQRIFSANKRLSQYGWRKRHFIEAKFLRGNALDGDKYKNASNKSQNVPTYIADLLRLTLLIEENVNCTCCTGRYFLHIYDAPPKYYLPYRNRGWLKKLTTEGTHDITLTNLDKEIATVTNKLGNLPNLAVDLNITNFHIAPVTQEFKPCYWLYLTRINNFAAELNENTFCISADRNFCSDNQDHYDNIVGYLAKNLNISDKTSETKKPSVDEYDGFDEEYEDFINRKHEEE